MNLAQVLDNEILPIVQKPSRYLGTEVNAVHKDPSTVEVRMALAFPDLYDLGLGNLGVHILYACVNELPWAMCERVYAPAKDMEAALRERGLPLFMLETKDSIDQVDLLGITLQSELTYTNILNILDMSGIPLRTEDRNDEHPLTCAGGPAVFNPEPIAPFMDFFVIGDGEDAIMEIAAVLRATKGQSRQDKLQALAALEGVYVPALYPFETLPDGQILPKVDHPKIRKRITRDLDGATFPVDYIVPYTQQVHDRISLEVLRGCTQGCRFCQAGMTTRPVRERSLENVDDLLQRTLDTTGYEEVSLVSLSTCDYSRVRQLVENTVERAKAQRVSVSLPSLRLDSFSVELADMVADIRRTGLTVAPEAASPRLRSVINKWIPDEELMQMTVGAYKLGWDHVKLYFMIGLPTERDDDIEAISDLAKRAVAEGKAYNPRAKVNLGVSTFVPKPFTPFQWARQIGLTETERRQDILMKALNHDSRIKFGRHQPHETFLEGLVSRADRRAADLLELAFRKGCRFDAWGEHLRFDLWVEAVDELSYDVEGQLRERDPEERLPWDHIDVLIDKEWFVDDWERAKKLQHAQDCRHRKCHKCGVIDHERDLCATMLRRSVKGRKPETAWERKPQEVFEEPPAVQRLWVRISRTDEARYLSHLESMNAWLRAMRRAKTPLSYSQGFHPHPKFAFSAAMPQNVQSVGEYMDITLVERVEPSAYLARLASVLPEGFGAHAITEVPLGVPALMAIAAGSEWTLFFPQESREHVEERLQALLAEDTFVVQRRLKKKKKKKGKRGNWGPPRPATREVDLRPSILTATMREGGPVPAIDMLVVKQDEIVAKPRELLTWFTERPELVKMLRRDTLVRRDGRVESLSAGWGEAELPEVDGTAVHTGC